MRNLRDLEGTPLGTDGQKVEELVRDLLGWNEESEGEGPQESAEYGHDEIQDMEERVRRALMGTKNSSAPGPDGISYRLIKGIKDTPLGEKHVNEVAVQLLEGTIPHKWKEMRVVLIPKPGRDLTVTKSWRPINLINCIGKLGEKVVADHLQDAHLLHHHQFGAVKGRSALEVVFQAVVKARRCMDGGGDAAWGFWDVKGGFQNVTKKEVIKRMGLTKEGRRWKKWITNFMWERSFAVSWDGKDRGVGKTNVGVPQGSPLAPVIFLIWMAPILEEMERRIRWEVGVDIELPSYVDDILLGIYDHGRRGAGIRDLDGKGEAIGELLARADQVLKEVALEKGLPLEDSKEEKLILRKGGRKKRKRNKEIERVKWLGVILDEGVEFDI